MRKIGLIILVMIGLATGANAGSTIFQLFVGQGGAGGGAAPFGTTNGQQGPLVLLIP